MNASRALALLLLVSLVFASACVPAPGTITGGGDGSTSSDLAGDTVPINDATADTDDSVAPNDGETGADADRDASVEDGPPTEDTAPSDTTTLDTSDATVDTATIDTTVDPFDAGLLLGRLGPPPTGGFSKLCDLEVRNDRGFKRPLEIAYSAIPIAREDDLREIDRLVVVDSLGNWVQAQFRVLSRWGRALGDPNDASEPIRWLQVSLPVEVDANATQLFELRRYESPVVADDPLAIQLETTANLWTLDNGVASFTLNAYNPALIEAIALKLPAGGSKTIYQHGPGAGPQLVLEDETVLSTVASYDKGTKSDVSIDISSETGKPDVTIVENGPVRVSVQIRGHFTSSHVDAFKVCDDGAIAQPRHRFGFTALLSFTRGRPQVHLRYNLRNECGRTPEEWLADDGVRIRRASWNFLLPPDTETLFYSGSADQPQFLTDETLPLVLVEQAPGVDLTGTWTRRARVLLHADTPDEKLLDSGVELATPMIGTQRSDVSAILQMPWIRFREPQGLEAENGRLSALFVSSPLRIGEAKAIWGEALLRFVLADVTNQAATIRDRGQAELERGLLVRLPVEQFNRTHVHPPIGRSPGSVTSMKTNYLLGITSAHNATVGYPVHPQITEPGQWAHFFSYGSQLWPDLPENAWTLPDHKNPFEYAPAANLGSPITAELLEFYRTGDPKWVWDVALPLARLMIFTAAYNKGPTPSALNGLVPSDSGSGEGDWHRLAEQFGWERAVTSNDALRDAYLVRPDPLFIDRFGVAAYTSIDFYPVLEAARAWFQAVELFEAGSDDPASAVQLFEVLESLENCAEFVPGPRSGACLDELERLFGELEADNLTTGMPCNGEKKPPDDGTCGVTLLGPILWNAWPTLHRYVTTLAKNPTPWRTMLVNFSKEVVKNLVQTSGTNLVVGGYWPYSLDCTIVGGKASDCVANPTGDFQIPSPYYPNILGFVGAMRAWDPTIVDCPTYVGWLATPKLYDGFVNETKDKYGYDGFSGLALHQVIFAVGALDECLAQ